jgi:dTDP-4-amino-4,6-dideoxygalactose transaminase
MFCVLLPLSGRRTRKAVRDATPSHGVATGVSYEALHLSTLGRGFGGRDGQYPNAERIARETLTLPLFTRMSEADVDRACSALREALVEVQP